MRSPNRIDEIALSDCLHDESSGRNRTPLVELARLSPGSALLLRGGRLPPERERATARVKP